jgi:peptide deformylase
MIMLNIITVNSDYTNILRKQAERLDFEELPIIQELIDNMIETAIYVGAIGLSAPQIGISKQLFILDDRTVCINPTVIGSNSEIISSAEGCTSIDNDKRYDVKRVREITIKYFDRFGKLQILTHRNKIYNIVIQHEIDHLYGKLISDRSRPRQ